MRCLWITVADPVPAHNGQFIYSSGLIEAISSAGADVDVLALARPGSGHVNGQQEGNVRWWLAEHEPRTHWHSVASRYPHIADRCRTPGMRRLLDQLLAEPRWNSIVFDGLSAAWSLASVLRHRTNALRKPKLVYISHNHEASVRRQIANGQPRLLKRQGQRFDALKTRLLERNLVAAVDLVTAITPEDQALYAVECPGKRIDVLVPGYAGRRVAARRITGDFPRRAVIIGSFEWIAKRMNLEEFVAVADPLFAAANAELQVVGSAEERFLDGLRGRVHATSFTGSVSGVSGYMDQARVAIVPERHGGGFKLKVLDYVFNRMPILALNGSLAGVPLRHGESTLLYSSHEALARGVLRVMDDLDYLNQLHDRAYAACSDRFDWPSRGAQFVTAVGAL